MLQSLALVFCLLMVLILTRLAGRSFNYPGNRNHTSLRPHGYKGWVGRYHKQPYHAVSCRGACKALRGMRNKRFLVKDAPPLPVPSCTEKRCKCKYVHHEDRRATKTDRRSIEMLRTELFKYDKNRDRRKSLGRRRSDLALAG